MHMLISQQLFADVMTKAIARHYTERQGALLAEEQVTTKYAVILWLSTRLSTPFATFSALNVLFT